MGIDKQRKRKWQWRSGTLDEVLDYLAANGLTAIPLFAYGILKWFGDMHSNLLAHAFGRADVFLLCVTIAASIVFPLSLRGRHTAGRIKKLTYTLWFLALFMFMLLYADFDRLVPVPLPAQMSALLFKCWLIVALTGALTIIFYNLEKSD